MKKIFKGLALGMMTTAFAAAPALAQQDECATFYQTYTTKYKSTVLAERKAAVDAGKQYIAKCNTPENKEQIDYLTPRVPKIESAIMFEESAGSFDAAIKDPKNVNAEVAFSAGKTLIAAKPELQTDIALVLATIGFDKAAAATPVDTYNAEAVNYAKQAIQKIEGGATSKDYGLLNYIYKTKEYPDGKNNSLGWMNYTIAYIMYNRQNMKKEAIPYFYKSTQFNSGVKKNPTVYQTIGDFYKDEYNRIDDERTKVANEAKTKTTDEEKKPLVDKTKELLALQKGYADRMIDAYARAYSLAPATDKPYKDGLFNTLKVLYQFRNDGKADGFNEAYISGFQSKPLPDPSSTVTPVVDTTTTATTTTSTTTTPSSVPETTKPAMTAKPTTGTSATTKTTDATKTDATTGTTTKTPAKKPAPKKKGTR